MKVVRNIILTVGFLCMGGVFTSCDENTLAEILPIIGEIVNPGTVSSYTGTATTESFIAGEQADVWYSISNSKSEVAPMQIDLTETQSAIKLAIPAYSESNNKVVTSNITISGLVATPDSEQPYSTLSIGENAMIDGSMTYDGVKYDTAALYIEKAIVSANELELSISIYFREKDKTGDYSTAINFTYTGSIISQ
ncbi:MAG: hypothetical protein K2O17_00955 [Bacteroidaceae bacterium]|nr:hypothetical protein [Bacteroidaceae bacterium]